MLPLERVRELLNDPSLSDEEVGKIRDEVRALVEDVIFEKWMTDRKREKDKKAAGSF